MNKINRVIHRLLVHTKLYNKTIPLLTELQSWHYKVAQLPRASTYVRMENKIAATYKLRYR